MKNQVSENLLKQANIVTEQLAQLKKIINYLSSSFGDISKMMSNYDTNLVNEVNHLKDVVDSYDVKSSIIYGELADSLVDFSKTLEKENLE